MITIQYKRINSSINDFNQVKNSKIYFTSKYPSYIRSVFYLAFTIQSNVEFHSTYFLLPPRNLSNSHLTTILIGRHFASPPKTFRDHLTKETLKYATKTIGYQQMLGES